MTFASFDEPAGPDGGEEPSRDEEPGETVGHEVEGGAASARRGRPRELASDDEQCDSICRAPGTTSDAGVERSAGGAARVGAHEGLVGIPAVGPVPESFQDGDQVVAEVCSTDHPTWVFPRKGWNRSANHRTIHPLGSRAAKPETGRSPRGRVSSRDQYGAEEEKARPKGAVHEQHQRARAAQGVVLDKDQEKAFYYSHEGLPEKAASTHCSQVASNLDGAARIGGSHPLPATARWGTGPARLRRAGVQVPQAGVSLPLVRVGSVVFVVDYSEAAYKREWHHGPIEDHRAGDCAAGASGPNSRNWSAGVAGNPVEEFDGLVTLVSDVEAAGGTTDHSGAHTWLC